MSRQRLFENQTGQNFPISPVQPGLALPIRMDFWHGVGLGKVGADLAAKPGPDLPGYQPFQFHRRIVDNRKAVRDTYLRLLAEIGDSGTVTPAAEWLLDNHHVVDENFRHLRRDLDWKVYRTLPLLELANHAAVPRVLALGWTLVAVTNSELSVQDLTELVMGFQTSDSLTIGEVWAIPAILRFILLENLRRLSDRVERSHRKRAAANGLADRLGLADAVDLAGMLAPHADDSLDETFAAQLLYRLRDGSAFSDLPLRWLEMRLTTGGTTPDLVIASEHARQSSGNVTVGNIIRSLRLMDEIDWLEWFEDVNQVDAILRQTADYSQLDKHTRNTYRDTVERLARRSDKTEAEVATLAVAGVGDRIDPGIALVGAGQPALERACGYRLALRERLIRLYRRLGWLGIALPSVALSLILALVMAGVVAVPPAGGIVLLVLLAYLPASEAAVGMVNFLGARLLPPSRLPAYDYTKDIPATARTIVVMPCLLTSHDDIDDLVRNLELHYLANPGGAVSFALLSDWVDNVTEVREDDAQLLDYVTAAIEVLATTYAHTGARRFFLLHRRRLYNPGEGVWMGWERKRGKLVELNQLLRGDADTSFIDPGAKPPDGIRFVVTLDADTRLPRGTVAMLVGKMAHPVNRAVVKNGRVISGYGIMQPRVTPSLTAGDDASIFQRVFSTDRGLDPYVFTVSDLGQDLLGQGNFTGKGIYDIDAFAAATTGHIPENTVLSHDLFEGSLARAALVTDVQFVEDFPVQYQVEAARQHRWTRGDWQLVPFIVQSGNGLNGLARLKMIDNLRRSLVGIAWIVASAVGWMLLSVVDAAQWQGMLVLALLTPAVLSLLVGLTASDPSVAPLRHLRVVAGEGIGHLAGFVLRLSFLAHQAWVMADAILRTIYRMVVSRQFLLEWRTASQVAAGGSRSQLFYLRHMVASPILGLSGMIVLWFANPGALAVANPILVLWLVAPLLAWKISQTLETEDRLHIRPADAADLRRIARITWRYFETFVTAASHHLPPDNFQDSPVDKIAERTSPTNISLYLLSILSARDFGWISLTQALDRMEATIATVERLPKHKGHLFNWYDTGTLCVLQPHYVSSVDSGNLAAHLVTLSSALRDWSRNSIVHLPADPRGMGDVLAVLHQHIVAIPDDRRALRPLRRRVEERIAGFENTYSTYLAEPQLAAVRGLNLSIIARDIHTLTLSLLAETDTDATQNLVWWAAALRSTCEAAISDASSEGHTLTGLQSRLFDLAERVRSLAFAMDFGFLLNPAKRLLSVGVRTDTGQLDDSCYDLLASEARLASFFAIAKGDVPNEHWFRLGRPVVVVGFTGALLSWSGSMFEYLMPPLVMHERIGGILHQSNTAAVKRQIDHGARKGTPWGASESAFNARDRELNYQYFAFGVPSLGLKRARADDLVIAPYATALASQIHPRAAVANLHRLADMGALGRHGYFDAVDLTPARLPDGAKYAVVRTVMAHHQGMVIVAIANAVLEGIHRDRFHDDPVVQAAELLLQEKVPREIVPITRPADAEGTVGLDSDQNQVAQTVIADPATAPRALGIFSNGRYARMVTATGAGYSRLSDRAVTRWRPDPTRDHGGIFLFLRDSETQSWWSATTAPKGMPGEVAQTIFSDHKAEFLKTVGDIETHLELIVASESDAEGMRLTIRNHSARARIIEVTSYGEIVLDTDAADRAHPAFSKMFVETAIVRNGTAITARRNRRTPEDPSLHLAHLICGVGDGRGLQAETDRRAFIGRGRDLATAAAFDPQATLSGSAGFTMDPIFALRRTVRLAPGKEAAVTFWTVVTDSAEALDLAISHYCNPTTYDHETRLAWTRSQIELRHMSSSLEEVAVFRDVAQYVIYPDTAVAAQDADIRATLGVQSALWSMGISGDHPIIVIRIDSETELSIIRKSLRMMEYFRHHGVLADLVILNERASSYTQDLQNALTTMCDAADRMAPHDTPRRVFALRRDQMSAEGWRGLLAAARIVMHTQNGTLSQQLARFVAQPAVALQPVPAFHLGAVQTFPSEAFDFWNGYGGFARDGKEYVVRLQHGQHTPHPWINVIGRDGFGFHVSAEGAGFTWSVNSRDYQITPWSNDPVSNPVGEAFFVRNRQTGRVATPFAALSADPGAIYEARHGLGQSQFIARTDWLQIEATQTLAPDIPAKLTRLRITNTGPTLLQLDCVAYAELVLGNNRTVSAPMIRARHDPAMNAVVAQNPFSTEFPGRTTALACDRAVTAHVVSRTAFLGGASYLTEAMARRVPWPVGDESTSDGDPCAAILTTLDLAAGATAEVTFILADAPTTEIATIVAQARQPGIAATAQAAATAGWEDFLQTLQVSTPDRSFDLMVNTWLPYQCLSCRIRARSAFYQASGAFGFRDQLQDTSALLLHQPHLARAQILNAAGRQFTQGDVQHWWLPGSGAGVRTTISDDVVWLAHSAARYLKLTGDLAILDVPVGYLAGAPLEPGDSDAFFQPDRADLTETLYAHCVRALDLAMSRIGPHGLPLMLGGDWNDGMNRVGEGGRGESIWLGWFLAATLGDFLPIAKTRGDSRHVTAWRAHRKALVIALDKSGWDGGAEGSQDRGWYRRGYFDDGTPLGSAQSEECRIDSIAQSWAAISGVGDPARATMAVDAALAQLQDTELGIMRLFTPPFEKTRQEPGYIKAYPPGVRENGGQYTHAAAWMVYALTLMGRGTEAHRLFTFINPISHAQTRGAAEHYRVEPYVVAADIYGQGDKSGRGGWTWYTGSAGWMYRAAVEGILGIVLDGGTRLRVVPALPDGWPGYSATLRHKGQVHQITVTRTDGNVTVLVDGRGAGKDGLFELGLKGNAYPVSAT